jgi:hypothetical protein
VVEIGQKWHDNHNYVLFASSSRPIKPIKMDQPWLVLTNTPHMCIPHAYEREVSRQVRLPQGVAPPIAMLCHVAEGSWNPPRDRMRSCRSCGMLSHTPGRRPSWRNEHDASYWCMKPAVHLDAAVIAKVTTQAKIAILGNVIAVNDPICMAEEIAMLDCFSGGRIISSFVRGTKEERHVRFDCPACLSP